MSEKRESLLKSTGILYQKKTALKKANTEGIPVYDELYYHSICLFLVLEHTKTGIF